MTDAIRVSVAEHGLLHDAGECDCLHQQTDVALLAEVDRLTRRPGERRYRDLLARERQDMAWLVHVVAVMYDDISGGRISKPMTMPGEVLREYERRTDEAIDEAVAEERERIIVGLASLPTATSGDLIDRGAATRLAQHREAREGVIDD